MGKEKIEKGKKKKNKAVLSHWQGDPRCQHGPHAPGGGSGPSQQPGEGVAALTGQIGAGQVGAVRTEGPARPASPAGAAGSVPRTAPRRGSFPPTVPRLQAGGDPRSAESSPRRPPPALSAAAARPAPIYPHGAVPGTAAPPGLDPRQHRWARTARSLPLRCPSGGRVQSGPGAGGAGRAGLLRARIPVRERRGRYGGAARGPGAWGSRSWASRPHSAAQELQSSCSHRHRSLFAYAGFTAAEVRSAERGAEPRLQPRAAARPLRPGGSR